MIFNFINLVGWRKLSHLSIENNYFYCDSTSFLIALRIFTNGSYKKNSGSSFAGLLAREDQSRVLYLTHTELPGDRHTQYVLPDLTKNELDWTSLMKRIDHVDIVVIGISSPMQNLLAQQVLERAPHLTIFCIGAMVPKIFKKQTTLYKLFNSVGLEFLVHLISSPIRTIKKLITIANEIKRLSLSRNERNQFRDFSEILQEGRNVSIDKSLFKK